jgi:hypothetical protein
VLGLLLMTFLTVLYMQKMQDHRYEVPVVEQDIRLGSEIQRLHQLTVYGRWIFVLALWLTVGAFSLWQLRFRIQLLMDYFTWATVKYGLAYHRISAMGLFLCLGVTTSVLVWQVRNAWFGLPTLERMKLQQKVLRIRQQGSTHPLWHLVCREEQKL